MSAATKPQPVVMFPARIVAVNGDREWHCPNCDAKLAQIIGARVVIRVRDRLISMRSDVEPDQVCWRCGVTSSLEREIAA